MEILIKLAEHFNILNNKLTLLQKRVTSQTGAQQQ